jgi:hypothetical protein
MNGVNDGGDCCSCDPYGSKGLARPGTIAECNRSWDCDHRLHLPSSGWLEELNDKYKIKINRVLYIM